MYYIIAHTIVLYNYIVYYNNSTIMVSLWINGCTANIKSAIIIVQLPLILTKIPHSVKTLNYCMM